MLWPIPDAAAGKKTNSVRWLERADAVRLCDARSTVRAGILCPPVDTTHWTPNPCTAHTYDTPRSLISRTASSLNSRAAASGMPCPGSTSVPRHGVMRRPGVHGALHSGCQRRTHKPWMTGRGAPGAPAIPPSPDRARPLGRDLNQIPLPRARLWQLETPPRATSRNAIASTTGRSMPGRMEMKRILIAAVALAALTVAGRSCGKSITGALAVLFV
jgi:hypothetical protein